MANITTTFQWTCSISSTGALEFVPQDTNRVSQGLAGWELTLSSEYDSPPGDDEDAILQTCDFSDGGVDYEVDVTSTVNSVSITWSHSGVNVTSPTYSEAVEITLDVTATPDGGGQSKTHTSTLIIEKRGRPLPITI